MSSLEKYIIKMHGKRIPFEVASEILGFDVKSAVDLVAERIGTDIKYGTRGAGTGVTGSEYVMSRSLINDTTIDFSELAHLLNLNMHYQCEEERFEELKKEGYFRDDETFEDSKYFTEVIEDGELYLVDSRS